MERHHSENAESTADWASAVCKNACGIRFRWSEKISIAEAFQVSATTKTRLLLNELVIQIR